MPKTPEQHLGSEISDAQMRIDVGPNRSVEQSANHGPQFYALALAAVAKVDYKKMEVVLIIGTGETSLREPIPLTFPGAGNRHFLGAMPEPGDMCIVGWGMQESGHSRKPYIVGWLIPGTTLGYDWLPTQPYAPSEFGLSPKTQHQLEGVAGRLRHKLRGMTPGNVVASSSQGSDIVLDESVLITNRRGNEIRIRDQDQAVIFRSLQQFHAGAGFRTYSGMVQRDAKLLPTQMFADSIHWSAPRQVDAEGNALSVVDLDESPHTEGFLTPATPFQRNESDKSLVGTIDLPSNLDPYDFLQLGLFITADGYFQGGHTADAIYGGKPIYRVSSGRSNGAIDTGAETFTEYRIEVAHSADGTLPVTEQTDGFDANRLPSSSPEDTSPLGASSDAPFIEFVMGTVVGNDPFTEEGAKVYGIPLRPIIFDGSVRSPSLTGDIEGNLATQAASLFRMKPPTGEESNPTFWATTKDGRLMASIVGPGKTWSTEIALQSGLHFGAGRGPEGRSVQADLDGAFVVNAKAGGSADNWAFDLNSETGAVRIYAGASTTVGGMAARNATSGEGESGLPGILLESATNTTIKASKSLTLSATRLDLVNAQEVNVKANSGYNVNSGGGISHSSDTSITSTMGKAEYIHSGPKSGKPSNGPIRTTKFVANAATGFSGGTADKYSLLMGDKVETLTAGDHRTTIAVGNRTYTVNGVYTATAGGSSMTLSSTGAALQGAGTALVAAAGATDIKAGGLLSLLGATMSLTAAAISFNSSGGVHSITPQIPGGMLTDGCIDSITGLPFSASGTLGIQTIRVN